MIQSLSRGKLGSEEVMRGLRSTLRGFAPTASIVTAAAFIGPAAALAEVKLPVPTVDQSAVASRGFFYVGGHYVGEPGKHYAGSDLRRSSGAERRATALSARPDPRRGANGDQLDGNTRRSRRLGRVFCRTRLCRLHDRSTDARSFRLSPSRRPHADVHGRKRAVPIHGDRERRHLAWTREAYAVAGRGREQGQTG